MLNWLYKFSDAEFGSGSGLKYKKTTEGVIWLRLTNPADEEIAKIRTEFKLPAKIFKKYAREPRSVRYGFKPLTFTVVDYHIENGRVMSQNILYIVGEHYVITVAEKQMPHFDEIFKNLKDQLGKINPDPGYVLYEILDGDSEENFDVLASTEKHITDLEENILKPAEIHKKVSEIIKYKRYLLEMWRRFWGTSKVIFSIKKGLTPIAMDEGLIRLFDDVHDTYIYQMEIVTAQRETLTDALTIYETVLANNLAQISNKTNQGIHFLTIVVLLLTGVTLVISVPNTIATIGGIPYLTTDKAPIVEISLAATTIIATLWFIVYWYRINKKIRVYAPKASDIDKFA